MSSFALFSPGSLLSCHLQVHTVPVVYALCRFRILPLVIWLHVYAQFQDWLTLFLIIHSNNKLPAKKCLSNFTSVSKSDNKAGADIKIVKSGRNCQYSVWSMKLWPKKVPSKLPIVNRKPAEMFEGIRSAVLKSGPQNCQKYTTFEWHCFLMTLLLAI